MEEIYLAYAGILTLATTTIYSGAWGSLPVRTAPAERMIDTANQVVARVIASSKNQKDGR